MKTFVIICGLNDKNTRKQEITTDNAKRRLAAIVLNFAAGATLTLCEGIYKHNDGGTVYEKSIKIEIAGISKKAALTIARQAKAALNQESIYYQSGRAVRFI